MPLPGYTGPAPSAPPAPGPAPYGQGYGPAPAQAPPRQPMSRGAKGALIGTLVGVGVLALLIGGGAIALSIMNQSRDPAVQVEQYLALIADGKAEAANAMVDPGLSKGESALLTDEVLASADERIEVLGIETTRRGGGSARVVAELRLDGERFEHTFSVEQGPKEWLFLDTWELRDPLVVEMSIHAYDDGSGVSTAFIGEQAVELALDMDTYMSRVHLYPGLYVVSGPESRYLDASRETVAVMSPDDEPWVEVWAEPNADFEDEIMSQAEEAAQRCVTVPNNMAAECPFWVRRTDLTQMTVAEKPTGFDSLSLDYFDTGKWYFGRAIGGSSSISEDWYWLQGSIEWDEQGNPRIFDWDFYDGYND